MNYEAWMTLSKINYKGQSCRYNNRLISLVLRRRSRVAYRQGRISLDTMFSRIRSAHNSCSAERVCSRYIIICDASSDHKYISSPFYSIGLVSSIRSYAQTFTTNRPDASRGLMLRWQSRLIYHPFRLVVLLILIAWCYCSSVSRSRPPPPDIV